MTWKDVIKNGKPDYLDFDGDGDTEEPMVDALKTVEQVESVKKGVDDKEGAARLLKQVIEDIEKGKSVLITTRLKQILEYLED
jgi:hypothetical protein